MNRGVTVEMDSFRMANYGSSVTCLICEEGNTPDAENCRNCFAPMILAHQAKSSSTAPIMFAALGPSAVGKTVYLGMLLDMLSRQPKTLQLAARGGFSVSLQENTLASLRRCEFPTKTPNEPDRWNWVHCEMRSAKHKQPVELVLPDIAGEALFQEIEHPRSYKVLYSLLSRCDGVMILIDGTQLQSGSLEEDYFTMKLLTHLCELPTEPKCAWRDRPVALIFSKADQCDSCFEDPAGYAERHAPGLWRVCKQQFRRHRFFATGVAGACVTRSLRGGAQQTIPLRVEPRGVIEPFEWLVESLR